MAAGRSLVYYRTADGIVLRTYDVNFAEQIALEREVMRKDRSASDELSYLTMVRLAMGEINDQDFAA